MDFELSEEQQMLREVSRSMLASTCPPALVRTTSEAGADLDEKLWQKGAELGWASLAVPEEEGGAGQGLVELCLVAEELGRAAAPGPFIETALVAAVAARGGAPGEIVAALAEGTAVASVVDDPSIVHAGGTAAHLLVLTAGDAPAARLAGVNGGRRRTTLDLSRGWWAVEPVDGIDLDVDPAWCRAAMTVLTAADALGVGERLLAMTVAYTSVREQFGRPIGSFQAVKHKAAEMLMTLKGVRAATYRAAMSLDAHTADAELWASVAKAHASAGIAELAGTALQLHGGIGFTWEHDLHLFLRRAKVDEAIWGGASHHHARVADLLPAT
ncbi:acyl-CoA/acyl-ACP dehydrogenase [Nocardioides sp. BP30]|uniref:acyl-CoA dehydrogenase family protein n=1 Tax=Nocardioides sp. BP30 TaxID=3036374 RepID=UPI0024694969|nr:acyl-CoA dehydrogenase family protein [Nocardioides sp. BP30]WGL54034.1 acyl-CoA/acyl-ACP dehydrogenase [Nocardioides sp. BP30]